MGVWPSNEWSDQCVCVVSAGLSGGGFRIKTPVYLMSQHNPKYVLSVVVPCHFVNTNMLL